MAEQFTSVDQYIRSFPDEVQVLLGAVRARLRAAAPGCEEKISYGIPTITLDGASLVHFAGWKNHIAVYPAPTGDEDFEQAIAPYRAAKSTLRFPFRTPMPLDLLERLMGLLIEQRRAVRSRGRSRTTVAHRAPGASRTGVSPRDR